MRNAERKFYTQNSHNWLFAVKFTETRRKLRLVPTNGNLCHYNANNSVKYTDPNGRFVINLTDEPVLIRELDYNLITQKELAEKIKISYNTLQSWITKDRLPDAEQALRIARELNTI